MNYIKEINAFMDWLETNPLDATTQSLWFHLMAIANKSGWPEWFAVANLTLMAKLGISENTLVKHRNILIQKGRIEYKSQGKQKPGKYRIIPFTSKFEANHEVTEDVTSKIEANREVTKGFTSNFEANHEVNREVKCEVNHEVNREAIYKLNKTKLDINNNDDDVYIISSSQPKTVNSNDPLVFYQQNVGPLTPFVVDLVNQYRKELPDDLIVEAFKLAIKNNARNLRYAEKILLSWIDKGICSLDDYKRHEAEWENKKANQEANNEPEDRKYSAEEIEAAARYIKKAVNKYDGDNVIEYIHSLGYPAEVAENAIKILIERGELAV